MPKNKHRRFIPRTKGGRIFLVLVILVAAGLIAYYAHGAVSANESEQVTYTTGTVEKMTLTSSVDAVGNVEWVSAEDVTSSISGEVSDLQVSLYEKVEEDDDLFRVVGTRSSTWITAPISGYVVALNVADGDEITGSSSSSSSSGMGASSASSSDTSTDTADTAATIVDLDTFRVVLSVSESDISRLIVGQKAVITFDALEDLTLTGKVTAVDFTGSNTSGVVSYEVVVMPDATNSNVRAGMSVSVSIITDVATDVLAVPIAALKTATDGSSYVQTLGDDGSPTDITVETGMTTDSYVEVTSGLTEGQEIVVSTSKSSSTTATTTFQRGQGSLLDSGGMPDGGFQTGGFAPPGQ